VNANTGGYSEMKIAVVTEDGNTISQHFGRAPYYQVLTIEDGKIVHKEQRDKAGHSTFAGHDEEHLAPGERHGFDAGAQARHASMMGNIIDCQVLIARGMGWGAYESLKGSYPAEALFPCLHIPYIAHQ